MPSPTEEPAAHTDEAHRVAQRRALADNARRITDPRLRAEVEALASGKATPADFVRFVDNSPQAWRGLHRTMAAYLALTDHQRTDLVELYHQQVAAIQAELDQPAPSPALHRRIQPPDVDESWEAQQSWLE
jgi:hypothetical protein